jgi:hypothetical protein
MEVCESGLIGQFRKLLYWKQYRRFESSRFRQRILVRGRKMRLGRNPLIGSNPIPSAFLRGKKTAVLETVPEARPAPNFLNNFIKKLDG